MDNVIGIIIESLCFKKCFTLLVKVKLFNCETVFNR